MLLLLTFLAGGVAGFVISRRTSSDDVEDIAAVIYLECFQIIGYK